MEGGENGAELEPAGELLLKNLIKKNALLLVQMATVFSPRKDNRRGKTKTYCIRRQSIVENI